MLHYKADDIICDKHKVEEFLKIGGNKICNTWGAKIGCQNT